MELKNFTYLFILAGSMIFPLIFSFEQKIQYYKKLKYILPAIILVTVIFGVWDIRFTEAEVWVFNPEYILGIDIWGLPLEEWLFFVVIPYCCVFIYEVLKYYLKGYEYTNLFLVVSLILMVLFGVISFVFRHQAYTFLTFLFTTVYLGYTVFRNKFKQHITKFYFAYIVSLLPFIIVNSLLNAFQVFTNNQSQILNIRFINFPIEDFAYLFLLLLMVITIYENLKENKYY